MTHDEHSHDAAVTPQRAVPLSAAFFSQLDTQDQPGHPKLSSPLSRLLGQRWWIEQGDALDVLRSMPNESLDIIYTEPPYGVNYQLGLPVDKKRPSAGDRQPFIWWLHDAYRSLKADSAIFVHCRPDVQEIWKTALTVAGFTVRSQIIWDWVTYKTPTEPQTQFIPEHDIIWFATKGKYTFHKRESGDVVQVERLPIGSLLHPNEKPGLLPFKILDCFITPDETIVCDPFCGSASVGDAVLSLGGRFLGIEREQSYVDGGRGRLETLTTPRVKVQHG